MKTGLFLAVAATAAVALLVILSNSAPARSPPKVVPHVDIQKYLGTWYEQAVIPFFWERGCERTRAIYSLNSDGTIKVDNGCYRDGKFVQSIGKASVDSHDQEHTNAKLKVQFSETFNVKADYWIVRLDNDYSYAVVSSPNYRYLWILSRDRVMSEDLYNSIISDLKNDGFSV